MKSIEQRLTKIENAATGKEGHRIACFEVDGVAYVAHLWNGQPVKVYEARLWEAWPEQLEEGKA